LGHSQDSANEGRSEALSTYFAQAAALQPTSTSRQVMVSGEAASHAASSGTQLQAAQPMSERLQSWRPRAHDHTAAASTAKRETNRPQPPSPFAQQMRTRQRPETRTATRTPRGKRMRKLAITTQEAAPAVVPKVSPEDWQRRLAKRRTAVAAIKATPEYEQVLKLRKHGSCDAKEIPLTPEPDISTVSKRQWEASVMHWRAQLRDQAPVAQSDVGS